MTMLPILVKIFFVGILIQTVFARFRYASLDLTDIAKELGCNTEEYDVTTEDGYILKMFRIVGDPTRPVLMAHGSMDSSDGFCIRGNASLCIHLARNNYDLWRINYRGNLYSRRHKYLNPDVDARYWKFSLHEIGYYDIPAAIDLVLKKTGQQQLSVIGYSSGTTVLYILGATRPEYNDKIKIMVSLASMCYLHNVNPLYSFGYNLQTKLYGILNTVGWHDLFGPGKLLKHILNAVCDEQDDNLFPLCQILFYLSGSSPDDIEPEFIGKIMARFPAGVGLGCFYQYAQFFTRNRFARLDYGHVQNKISYNSSRALEYNVDKVTMKVAIIAAKNDIVSTVADVDLLRRRLPNVVEYRLIDADTFSHLSYIFSRHLSKLMNPHILHILNKYN